MESSIAITAFYKFFSITETELETVQSHLLAKGQALDIYGLVLLSTEGINGTVSGSKESIEQWKQIVQELAGDVTFKDSQAAEQPFKRFFVKIRDEIVALGDTEVVPDGPNNHLSPDEWDAMIASGEVVVLDTRNTYETDIGIFDNAVDPRLEQFSDFPEYVEKCSIPKDKKVLMYCTGGIRCEKASIEMQRQGYSQVYQLDGGILRYLQEKPEGHFKGECFVFDHRTAVDAKLNPSERYHLCPHCGDPGDERIACTFCGEEGVICTKCKEHTVSCSKNCAHHLKIGSKPKVKSC